LRKGNPAMAIEYQNKPSRTAACHMRQHDSDAQGLQLLPNTESIQSCVRLKYRDYRHRPQSMHPTGQAVTERRPQPLVHPLRSPETVMNRRISSVIAFSSSAVAATLAAMAMAGSARADDITIDNTPFVSSKTRDEVKAEFMSQRGQYSSAGYEWAMQHNTQQPFVSTTTRAQVTAEYIASRDQVHAMDSEDSGSASLALVHPRTPTGNLFAKSSR